MSSEGLIILSPTPCKSFAPCNPSLYSEKNDADYGPYTQGASWYDNDDAIDATRDMVSPKTLIGDSLSEPAWTPDCLYVWAGSSATTSMSPTPELDGSHAPLHGTSHSPSEYFCTPQASPQNRDERVLCRSNHRDEQLRKVFVGGIPQTVDQKEFNKMFSKVAKVKKAWLQAFREEKWEHGGKKHRGFGFVVFHDKEAIEQMLGDAFSRFVTLENGLKLEVKRAVGQESLGQEYQLSSTPPPVSSTSAQADACTNLTHGPHFPACNPGLRKAQGLPYDACANLTKGLRKAQGKHINQHVLPSSQQPNSNADAYYSAYNSAYNSGVRETVGNNIDSAQQHIVNVGVSYSMLPPLTEVLLEGFLGQMPQNRQELKWVLVSAMPDRYFD